ncbi:hypothetical protein [Pararhizobium sp.]|nr:hypothetical protein [Pararhizobium sp.]MDO9415585.1 hypothetical protein [Pararhizobium sp.]
MFRTSFETLVGISAFIIIVAAITYTAVSENMSGAPGVSGEITSSIPR